MDIMDALTRARPASLEPQPDPARRASDLARAIATPRDATPRDARDAAIRHEHDRRRIRRPARPARPARLIAAGVSVAALAGTAGAVVALSATGSPAARPGSAAHPGSAARPGSVAARGGNPVGTPGELRTAILTAFNGVSNDVFYTAITEIYPGKQARWDEVSDNWSYPLQPRTGQEAHARSLVLPRYSKDKSDTEWIYRQPAGSTAASIPTTRTEMIDVQYGNRTWSDTTSNWGFPSETGGLQELRQAILTGQLGPARKTVLNGQSVLEFTVRQTVHGSTSVSTYWIDPATYLPAQTMSKDAGMTYQVDYGFLPPTAANIAKLKVTVPAGFTRTATQKLP